MTAREVLAEFVEAQGLTGYIKPPTLGDIERTPTNDEFYSEEDSRCAVDVFFHKRKGLK